MSDARAAKYWVAFAKTGDPRSAGGAQWLKFDSNDEALVEFGFSGVPAVQKHFHMARLDWVEQGLGK